MTVFDLLLILLVLATAAAVVAAGVAMVFRRWRFAGWLLAGVLAIWIVYLGTGTAVAVLAPQHILSIGEDRCFDEMCFAVTGFSRTPSIDTAHAMTHARGALYMVEVRITNRSRGRAQREIGRKGVLIDRSGRVYQVSREGMQALSEVGAPPYPGLDAEVGPGQSLTTHLVFELPEDVADPGFALGSNLAMNPARIVIGDEDHFLHWPTVVPLD